MLKQPHVRLAECVLALVVFDGDRPQNAVAAEDRNRDRGLAGVGARNGHESLRRVLGAVFHHQWLARLHQLQERRPGRNRRHRQTHAVLVRYRKCTRFALGSYQRIPMSPVLNTSRNLVADQVDDGLEIELRGHALLDAVDHRQLGGALLGLLEQALRLVEQARVLQRHAHARRHGAEQAHLGFAVGVLALVVLQDDGAEHAVAAEDGHGDQGLPWSVPGISVMPERPQLGRGCSRPSAGASAASVKNEPARRRWRGRRVQAHTVLVFVQVMHQVGLRVVPADADLAGLEHLAQLVADQVDDGLEVELRGHALLDAVDHRQLGGALLGFLQQPLRLVEQARVFQRHAHARRDRGEPGARPPRRRRSRARSPPGRSSPARDRCRRWGH